MRTWFGDAESLCWISTLTPDEPLGRHLFVRVGANEASNALCRTVNCSKCSDGAVESDCIYSSCSASGLPLASPFDIGRLIAYLEIMPGR